MRGALETRIPPSRSEPCSVDVFLLPVRVGIAELDALLVDDERAHAASLAPGVLRDEYMRTRALVRYAVVQGARHWVDARHITFRQTRQAKPLVSMPKHLRSLNFSVAKTRGMIACAVRHGGSVGVDVEQIAEGSSLEIARRLFAADEANALARLGGPLRRRCFLELWALKEAYGKARGVGLRPPLSRPRFAVSALGSVCLPSESRYGFRFFLGRPDAQHVLAVAARCEGALSVRLQTVERLTLPQQ